MLDEYPLTLRQADQSRADFAAIADDFDFIRKRLKEDDLKISSYPRFHVRPLIRRIWDLEKRSGPARGALLAILAFAITSIAPDPSHAATPSLTPLVSFNGTDGLWPLAGLIADARGNLFGTTSGGGAYGGGTVFEVTDSGFVPPPLFAGTPGKPNCYGQSVSALTQQYGRLRPDERVINWDSGLAAAAAVLGYSSVPVLQNAIAEYCAG
jgi:uncharacterized repeat protein (TIGR03803 family)